VTFFGLLLTPVFFVLIRRFTSHQPEVQEQAARPQRAPLAIGQDPEVHGA
jgi:hypothetical protein